MGCHDCKSANASSEYAAFGTVLDPKRGAGRVAVCPQQGKPAPGQKETTSDGLTYTAVEFIAHYEPLRMSRLPCWSGTCDHYLLEVGTYSLLADDGVCNFWANRTFGCHNCKSAKAVRNDTRLHAFSTSLPPGRASYGRVALCPTQPEPGLKMTVSGVSYTIDGGDYWKQ